MKNIAHSLLLTLLFGIFFPSYQAYASGKKFSIALEKQKINNDNLVDRLANSKTFEYYFTSVYYICMITQANLSTKNEKQIKEFSKKIEDLQKIENYTFEDISNKTDLKINKDFNEKFVKIKQKYLTEFSDLFLLDEQQKVSILERAVEKGNLFDKAKLAVVDTQSCFDTSNTSYANCMTKGANLGKVATILAFICAGAVFLCLAELTFGTSTVAAVGIVVTAFGFCLGAAATALNNVYGGSTDSNCASALNSNLNSCVLQYGPLTFGGAK